MFFIMYGNVSQVRENQKVLSSEHKQILSNQEHLRKMLAKITEGPNEKAP